MKNKSFVVICVLLILVFSVPVYAALPDVNISSGSLYTDLLTESAGNKLIQTADAQVALNTIYLYRNTGTYKEPILSAIFAIEVYDGAYQYYAAFAESNGSYANSYDTVNEIFSIFPRTTLTLYIWTDTNAGGWMPYNGNVDTLGTVDGNYIRISNSYPIYFLTSSNNPTANTLTSTIKGTASLKSDVADTWIATYQFKLNGYLNLPNDEAIYTQAQYDARYQQGISAGRIEVLSEPNDYNLFTAAQYNGQYQAGINFVVDHPSRYDLYTEDQYQAALQSGGGTTTLSTIDIPSIILSVPTFVNNISHGLFDHGATIFGIDLLALGGVLIVITFTIFIINKVKN